MLLPHLFPMVGAVAQLGERVNGIHEVSGSIPLGSTNTETFTSRKLMSSQRGHPG